VRNLKTLNESLHKYIAGETISDYTCSNCNKRVDIMKRCVLTSLPNILIIHLQRIVFNLDTLMNEKINSRLEFPLELNMESFMKEESGKRKDSSISESGVDSLQQTHPKVNKKAFFSLLNKWKILGIL
jgi:uncharacterized UBP type Zn finger protein